MKLLFAMLVLALASGCMLEGQARLAPDDSPGATAVGPGQYHFEGARHLVDTCTPCRAQMITAPDELSEWYRRQHVLRAERDAGRP
ncbi:MAG TPA: hypothetical protein VFC90_11520 [Planctomycetota bacterium]|nr:hypothetical protein [Planctomycetota bacterium]